MVHSDTKIVQAGKEKQRDVDMVNTPVYRASTILFPTMEAYHEAESSKYDDSYATTGTQTAFVLQEALSELDGGGRTIVLPSGLAAISLTFMAFLSQGDHVLVPDSVYGPTRRLCNKMLKRFGIKTSYYDPLVSEGISALIQPHTKMILTESPGSLTFEVQDVPAIVEQARKKNVLVAMDNSWATSLLFNPFDYGVDVSIQAGTKYISGHSDVLLGAVSAQDTKIFDTLYTTFHMMGICASPDDCYLALRGLRTMAVRLKQHEKSAFELAQWLQMHPKVSKVLHPALESHPTHSLWKRDFKGSSGLFTIILDKNYPYESLCHMINNMEIFKIGASWGGFESLVMHFDLKNIRTATSWTEENSCVRLYVGLEAIEDMKEDLRLAFDRLP